MYTEYLQNEQIVRIEQETHARYTALKKKKMSILWLGYLVVIFAQKMIINLYRRQT